MSESGRLAKPGELHYRAGTYRTFLAAMQRGARRKPPLATLNTEIAGDVTNALMSGWARLCDVLTFYQERIANEGYLPTATEPASVLCLAAQIGERRRPAVGARTSLALHLIDAAGQPDSLTIESGPCLAVQNAPASPDTLPVVFEGAERLELRPAWNALPLAIAPVPLPPSLWRGCRSLRLVGTVTGIRPGSGLLLDVADGPSWLVIVDTVQVDRPLGCTLITWRTPVFAPRGWRATVTAATLFATTTGLFGRTAMLWSDVPEKQKEAIGVRAGGVMKLDWSGLTPDPGTAGPPVWARAANAMPPPPNIQALLGLEGRGVLAGTARGLFRSLDGGTTWQALNLPQPQGWHDVLSLHRDQSGTFYAGTAAGVVLTSGDGGDGWAMLTQTVSPLPLADPKQGAGFFHFLDRRGASLKPAEPWMLRSPVRAILTWTAGAGGAPEIFIGTDMGVFAMRGDSPDWQPFNGQLGAGDDGAADISVAALALSFGQILAATNRGLFSAGPAGTSRSWTGHNGAPLECTSLVVVDRTAYVGTPDGIFRWRGFIAWESFNQGLGPSPPAVTSLLPLAGSLCAATAAGFFIRDISSEWAWIPLPTQDLTLFEIDKVFADGLDKGTVPPALSQRFERFGIELEPDLVVRPIFVPHFFPPAQAGWELCKVQLEAQPGEPTLVPLFRIYAGTPLRVTQLIRNQAGPADPIAAADHGLLASLPIGPVLNAEWPYFAITSGEARIDGLVEGAEIFLDRKVDGIETGSRIVLAEIGTGLEPKPEVHSVIASDAVLHKAFGQQRTVTRIIVRPTAELLSVDLRTTNVYVASRALAPFTATNPDLRPLAGDVLILPGLQSGLTPGRSLLVSGPRPGAVILPAAAGSDCREERLVARASAEAGPALDQQMVSAGLKDAFAAAGIKLSLSAGVSVIAPGARWLVRDGDRAWRLDLPPGADEALPLRIVAATFYEVVARAAGRSWTLACGGERLIVPNAEVEVVRATSSQASLSEIAIVRHVAIDLEANVTRVRLTAPLSNLYDSASCRICANVVRATQGETVQTEVLGSGRPAQAPQSFTLRRSPLTYIRDWDGPRSSLRVEVNGRSGRALRFGAEPAPPEAPAEHWLETESLAHAASWERVYAVSTDRAGRTTLRFGDGIHGARLPSGNDNVTATYRWGAGALGNVPAGTLIALRKRPAGIRSVTNPVAATGGADAETIDALRARAPRRLHCCGRIVTLADYEAFARNFPGIGRVYLAPVDAATIRLTLATDDGRPVSQAPGLRKALARAIEASRGDRLALRLEDPRRVTFDVGLSIAVDPDADPRRVAGQVEAALAAAFGAARCDFGQPVEPRQVVDAASLVPGVRSAALTALHRSGAPELQLSPLAAGPDEWLVINAATGIAVEVQP